MFDVSQLQIFYQLLLAVLLGALVGVEREYRRKEAGLRTFALVSLGAALFTIVSFELFRNVAGIQGVSFDPSRIVQAVAIGIGFIGGGIIIYRQFHFEGVTTATGLWVTAGIGVAVGSGLYTIAITGAILAFVVLSFFRYLEQKFFQTKKEPD